MKELTGSNAWVGAVNLANFLPILVFVLYAGSLADRLDRRKLIIWTQAVMMPGGPFWGVATSLGWSSLPVIIIDTVVIGVAFVFNFPAWRALVPDLVPPNEILNAVALDAAGYNMARFIGPALGALILNVWSAAGAFYINAISFMTVIAALMVIRYRPDKTERPRQNDWARTKEGISYVRRNRWAANLLIVLGIAAFFGLAFAVLLPGIARDVLHKGSWAFGLLLGGIGLGAVIGAPLVTLLNRRIEESRIIRYAMLVTSLMIILMALSKTYWLSILAAVGVGVSFLMVAASINTVLQSRVERDMRGRIMSFYILLFQGTAPVGGLLMGYISDVTSTSTALLIGGCVCLALAVAIIAFPSILKDAVSPAWQSTAPGARSGS